MFDNGLWLVWFRGLAGMGLFCTETAQDAPGVNFGKTTAKAFASAPASARGSWWLLESHIAMRIPAKIRLMALMVVVYFSRICVLVRWGRPEAIHVPVGGKDDLGARLGINRAWLSGRRQPIIS